MVDIRFGHGLMQYTENDESTVVEAKTVGECLDGLVARYPKLRKMVAWKGNAFDYIVIIIDGKTVSPSDLDTPLAEDTSVYIMIPYSGG